MNTFLVVVVVLLAAAAIYLLLSLGILGSGGKAARSSDEATGSDDSARPDRP